MRLGRVGGQGAVQEVARARALHDLEALVFDGLAEGVIAVDDRLLRYLSVGDQKLAVLTDEHKRSDMIRINPQCQGQGHAVGFLL